MESALSTFEVNPFNNSCSSENELNTHVHQMDEHDVPPHSPPSSLSTSVDTPMPEATHGKLNDSFGSESSSTNDASGSYCFDGGNSKYSSPTTMSSPMTQRAASDGFSSSSLYLAGSNGTCPSSPAHGEEGVVDASPDHAATAAGDALAENETGHNAENTRPRQQQQPPSSPLTCVPEPVLPASTASTTSASPEFIPIDYEAEMEDCCQYTFSEGPYCPFTSVASAAPRKEEAVSDVCAAAATAADPCSLTDYIPIDYEECMEEYDAMCACGQAMARPSDGTACAYFTGEDEDSDEDVDTDKNGEAGNGESENGCDSVDSFSVCCAPISPSYCSPPVGHAPMFTFPASCFISNLGSVAAAARNQQQLEEELSTPFSPAWLRHQQMIRNRDVAKLAKRRHQRMQEQQNYFALSHENLSFSLKCFLGEACRQDMRRLRALPASFFVRDENVRRLLNTSASSSLPTAMRCILLSSTLLSPGGAHDGASEAERKKAAFLQEVRRQWRQLAESVNEELEDPYTHYRSLVSKVNVLSLFTHNVPLAVTCAKADHAAQQQREREGRQGDTQYVSLSATHAFDVCGSAMVREMNDATVDAVRRRRLERQEAVLAQLQRQGTLFLLPTLRAEESEPPVPVVAAAEPSEPAPSPLQRDSSSALSLPPSGLSTAATPATDSLLLLVSPKRELPSALASGSLSRKTLSTASSIGLESSSSTSSDDDNGAGSGDSWEELPPLCLATRDNAGDRSKDSSLVLGDGEATTLTFPETAGHKEEEEEGYVGAQGPGCTHHLCSASELLADCHQATAHTTANGGQHRAEENEEEGEVGDADGFVDLLASERLQEALAALRHPQLARDADGCDEDADDDVVVLSREDSTSSSEAFPLDVDSSDAATVPRRSFSSSRLAVLKGADLLALSSRLRARVRGESGSCGGGTTTASGSKTKSHRTALRRATASQLSSFFVSSASLQLGSVNFSSCASPSKLFSLPAALAAAATTALHGVAHGSSNGSATQQSEDPQRTPCAVSPMGAAGNQGYCAADSGSLLPSPVHGSGGGAGGGVSDDEEQQHQLGRTRSLCHTTRPTSSICAAAMANGEEQEEEEEGSEGGQTPSSRGSLLSQAKSQPFTPLPSPYPLSADMHSTVPNSAIIGVGPFSLPPTLALCDQWNEEEEGYQK